MLIKRILSAVLVILLLLGLCACSSEAQGGQSGQSQAEPGGEAAAAQTDPGYALAVQVTINPEFTLYLDSTRNILSAEAGNEDAEALFAQLDVAGKPYAEGMAALLSEAYDQGYLAEGSQISISLEIVDAAGLDLTAIHAPIAQFEQDNGVAVEAGLSLKTNQVPEEGETAVIDGQKVYVHRVDVHNNSGNGVQIVYATRRVLFEDPEKYAVKSVYQGYNGDYGETYFDNGMRIKSFRVNADGSSEEFTYYSNGNQKTVSVIESNGDYQNEEYYESGSMKRIVSQFGGDYSESDFAENGELLYGKYRYADGTYGEEFYDGNGNRTGYNKYQPNGDYEIWEFYSNDNTKTVEFLADGNYSKTTYNEDGTMASSLSKNSDGTQTESEYTWYESGNLKRLVSQNNGDYSETDYAENGNILYGTYRNADGTYGEAFYDDSGNCTGYNKYQPNGDYEIVELYANGNFKTQEYSSGGFHAIGKYNEDSSLQYHYDSDEGGREFFFSGGKLTKAVVGGVTHTDAESLSNFAAGFGITQ